MRGGWTKADRDEIDARIARDPVDPMLDLWEALRKVGGMPPMQPDHARVIMLAFRREREALTNSTQSTYEPKMWTRLDSFEANLCASENCNRMGVAAAWHFERGGIGSHYCDLCKSVIERGQRYVPGERVIVSPPDDSLTKRVFLGDNE